MKASSSRRVAVRGLDYHVRSWGRDGGRKVLLLHGWMDVSASFQFLADAMDNEWQLLAPDWRGFGLSQWPQDGYWFADYVADLDALVRALADDEPVDVVGHSLGAIVAMMYAGLRPQRVRHVVALDGFGVPDEAAKGAPDKFGKWLDALESPPDFSRYRSMSAVADRLQKNNPRLPRDKAEFLATHWAEAMPDGSARLRADPRHKLPFPVTSRMDDMVATWQRITAPILWVAAAETHITSWLAGDGDPATEIARRHALVPHGELVVVADAGHMLHHDQPDMVARLLESFLRR